MAPPGSALLTVSDDPEGVPRIRVLALEFFPDPDPASGGFGSSNDWANWRCLNFHGLAKIESDVQDSSRKQYFDEGNTQTRSDWTFFIFSRKGLFGITFSEGIRAMSSIVIRQAEERDLPHLVRFNLEMALETEGKKLDVAVLGAGVRGIFEDATRGFYLVAEIDGVVIGSLMVTKEWSDWRNGDFWWIQSVYVLPEFRRQGVFRELYEEARGRAKNDEGVCGCRLYVETDNQSARQVYLKHGFVETGYLLFEDVFRQSL